MFQFVGDQQQRPEVEVEFHDLAHLLGLGFVDHEFLVHQVEAKHEQPAGPHTLAPRRRHLVAGALRDHLAFELGESTQHGQEQPPRAGRSVEVLSDRNEAGFMLVKEPDDPQEVEHGTADSVIPLNRDHVDLAVLDVLEHALQRRSVRVLA